MAERIRRLEDVIGQTVAKNFLINMIMTDHIPDFILLLGDSGSGKSTLAEWLAMAVTCPEGHLNPCMECDVCKDNLKGLEGSGKSVHIKKMNLAKVAKKTDIQEVIKEIFSLPAIPDAELFYILEEIQALGEFQDAFLEELDRVPEHVHIIGTGTEKYKLKETTLSRAFVINFTKLAIPECRTLINNKCIEFDINLSNEDKMFLIHSARNNARTIVNTLENIKNMPDIREALRSLFNSVSYNYYLDFLTLCFKDYSNFTIGVDVLESSINIQDFWKGLKSFFREAVYYYYGNAKTVFTPEEQEKIYNIFKTINSSVKIQKIRRITQSFVRDDEDIEIALADIREVIQASEIKLKYNEMPESPSVKEPKLTEIYKDETARPKTAIKGLTLAGLNDKIHTSEVYK